MMIKITENKTPLSCLSNDKNTNPEASVDILVLVQRRGRGLRYTLSHPAHLHATGPQTRSLHSFFSFQFTFHQKAVWPIVNKTNKDGWEVSLQTSQAFSNQGNNTFQPLILIFFFFFFLNAKLCSSAVRAVKWKIKLGAKCLNPQEMSWRRSKTSKRFSLLLFS